MGKPFFFFKSAIFVCYLTGKTCIIVSRNITLNTRIVICEPGSTDIISSFEDRVVNNLSHVRKSVLELVCHQKTREAGADGEDLDFSWSICIV